MKRVIIRITVSFFQLKKIEGGTAGLLRVALSRYLTPDEMNDDIE